MAAPTVADWDKLKRLGRYLLNKSRVVVGFPYQSEQPNLDVYVDTDYAGCPKTRKSTSGGAVMLGLHCLKTWSSNQPVVALSSGEAEFYGMVKGSSNALGIKGTLDDMGVGVSISVYTDSSAAKGIASRRGLGKVRHVELSELWLQDQVAKGRIRVHKVGGDENFADSFTKHSNSDRISQTLHGTNQKIVAGRHSIMPSVAQ